jgi:hypothetical protein
MGYTNVAHYPEGKAEMDGGGVAGRKSFCVGTSARPLALESGVCVKHGSSFARKSKNPPIVVVIE